MKIDWKEDIEEFDGDHEELFDLFDDWSSRFVIKVSDKGWDSFVEFINHREIKLNRRGVENFKKYLDRCNESIYLFVKSINTNSSFKVSFYTDESYNASKFSNDPLAVLGYKGCYDFDNQEFVEYKSI